MLIPCSYTHLSAMERPLSSLLLAITCTVVLFSLFVYTLLSTSGCETCKLCGDSIVQTTTETVRAEKEDPAANVTVTLQTRDRVRFFRPHVMLSPYARHMLVTNVNKTDPMIVSVTRNRDSKIVFTMRIHKYQSANGTSYLSLWLT